jgi:hypothetical protein
MLMQGVTIVRAGREPCPVCGHPTGDCTGDTSKAPPVNIKFGPIEEPKRDEPDVLVEQDIWKEVQLTSQTKTRVLVAKAGSYIPVSLAKEHGLID